MIHPTCNLPSDARTQCHLPQVVCGVCTRQSPDTTCCEPWAVRVCRFRSVLGPSRGEFHYKFRRAPLQGERQLPEQSAAWPRSAPVGRFRRFRRTAPSLWERERFIQRARTGGRWQLFRLTKSYRTEYFSWTSNAFTFFRAARLRCPEIPVPTFTDYAQNRTWESQFPQASEFSSTSTIILEAPTPKHYRETWPEIPQSEQRTSAPRVDSKSRTSLCNSHAYLAWLSLIVPCVFVCDCGVWSH